MVDDSGFEQITEFEPAFDKRDPDPNKNYGIHGVTLRMVLKGPEGAVQFVLYTNWQLPHVQKETDRMAIQRIGRSWMSVVRGNTTDIEMYHEGEMQLCCFYHPMPANLGYHSPKPHYEGQTAMGAVNYSFKDGEETDFGGTKIKVPKKTETGTFTPCEYVPGGPCYYDESTLNAEPIYEVLLREGSDGVWRELRSYYDRIFRKEAEEVKSE